MTSSNPARGPSMYALSVLRVRDGMFPWCAHQFYSRSFSQLSSQSLLTHIRHLLRRGRGAFKPLCTVCVSSHFLVELHDRITPDLWARQAASSRPSDRWSKTPDGHVLRRQRGTMSWWRFAQWRQDRLEKRRRRTWWNGRRGTCLSDHEDSGLTPWHPSCK